MRKRPVRWRRVFAQPTSISASWDWFMVLAGKAAEPVLVASVLAAPSWLSAMCHISGSRRLSLPRMLRHARIDLASLPQSLRSPSSARFAGTLPGQPPHPVPSPVYRPCELCHYGRQHVVVLYGRVQQGNGCLPHTAVPHCQKGTTASPCTHALH
ncbi:MAG: hypothetical protein J2P36_00945 [Ktedonobacteraceae bacterium]|nr:hypothetical protein [Ktedonobacteraceae bacterium]